MIERSIAITAPADRVFGLVSDPMRTGEWSPECVRCRWIKGATSARVGAKFRGTSRNGWRRWTTTSTVVDLRPIELFAWEVTYFGLPVARWEYRITQASGEVVLTESVTDRRGRLLRTVSPMITGARNRSRRNADTMESTLVAIRTVAELQQA